jgi:hypothetical protein
LKTSYLILSKEFKNVSNHLRLENSCLPKSIVILWHKLC